MHLLGSLVDLFGFLRRREANIPVTRRRFGASPSLSVPRDGLLVGRDVRTAIVPVVVLIFATLDNMMMILLHWCR